ncbi:MAG: PorT family protein [Prevotella sp.]|nr:PorT family protein [Prevotella sp.]
MKYNRIVLTLVFSLFALLSSAQTVQFGVRGGSNISGESRHKYSADVSNSTDYRMGFNAGGMVNLKLSEKFDVEADVLYSMQGFKQDIYTTVEGSYDNIEVQTVTSHYLNIPIVAKYYVVNGLYVECGPQVGFLLGRTNNKKDWSIADPYEYSKSKKVDFGIVAGLGYAINDNFFIDARYSIGFTGTSKIYDGGKNRNIQVSIGYLFGG